MSRDALLRYRAERLLRRDFSGLRTCVTATVRSRLGTHAVQLDTHDLDACYAQAWQGLYSRLLAGEQIDDVTAWLVLVTYRRALDELGARSRHSRACEGGAELVQPSGSGSARADFAADLDDRARLRHVLEALNRSLSARERQAASLCYLQGLTRAQAAQHMGMSQARMRKLMDGSSGRTGVAAKVGAALEAIGEGRWCEQQGSLIRAYAFGILDPDGERHALAHAHLRECPACRAFVRSLRGLAAVLPPLPLALVFSRAHRRAKPRRAKPLHSTGASAPLAKLAAVGAVGLSLGGGLAVLAVRAPGKSSGAAPLVRRTIAHAPHRSRHLPIVLSRRHQSPRRRPAVSSRRPSSTPPATISGPPPNPTPSEARAPLEEFSPERAPSRRG